MIEFKCPLIISKFNKHFELKEQLLRLLDKENSHSINPTITENDSITATDWNFNNDDQRNYLKFIKPYIIDTMMESFKILKPTGLVFGNFWFQQYYENDLHGWHVHKNCHWTNVYYVELPFNNLKTEILKPGSTETIDFDAEEGDIISFPSFLYHRSPINTNKQRKTIISFNLNFL